MLQAKDRRISASTPREERLMAGMGAVNKSQRDPMIRRVSLAHCKRFRPPFRAGTDARGPDRVELGWLDYPNMRAPLGVVHRI